MLSMSAVVYSVAQLIFTWSHEGLLVLAREAVLNV